MDNTFIIDNLLSQNRSESLEFKTNISYEGIAKLVTFMLNKRGGDILIGVDEQKRVVGLDSKMDAKNLLKKLTLDIQPSVPIDVQNILYHGKKLMIIRVWEGSQKPYAYKGEICRKADGSTFSEISQIMSERKEADSNWERNPVLGAEIEDLDMEEVRRTMVLYQQSTSKNSADEESFLTETGLIQNGNLTNACIVLYAKNPMRYIVQSGIRLSVFSSASASDLVDSQNYEGNVFKNVEAIFQYIDNLYGKVVKIDGLHRIERWNYPRVAVREGIMNAIVHRDYNSYQGFLQILAYPNHLDIANYGVTQPIVSFVEMGNTTYSMLRNPDIAYHCYYRRLIEMRGTGIPRMLADCKSNGFAIPEFTINNQVLRVTFPQLQVQNYYSSKNDFESLLDESFESLNINVKRRMLAILTLLDKNPGLRTTAISDKTGIPVKSIERYLSDLKQCGLIVYKGSSGSGGYYIVHDNE